MRRIMVDEHILSRFTRDELRTFASAIGVDRGRNKADTIRNLLRRDLALNLKHVELQDSEGTLSVCDHGDKYVASIH